MFKFKNGDIVRDLVTGLKGAIVSRTDHLTGCNRYYVQPRIGDDGKLIDGCYFDEMALEHIQEPRIELEPSRHREPPG